MPRYYFHVRDGNELVRDGVGLALPDLSAARAEGHMTALDIARQSTCNSMDCSIEIADQIGTILDGIAIEPSHRLLCWKA